MRAREGLEGTKEGLGGCAGAVRGVGSEARGGMGGGWCAKGLRVNVECWELGWRWSAVVVVVVVVDVVDRDNTMVLKSSCRLN